MREATNDDDGLIVFLQQYSGYMLTGDIREHALLFIYGPGGNGKSGWLNTVSGILGDYCRTAPMETFTASPTDRHPTEPAMLRGARMVCATETEEGRPWAESKIKQLTGGDRIAARFMRQDFFEFQPQFKLVVIGNHWLTWFGAECIAVAAAMLNLLFVPFVAFDVVALPDGVLTLPIVAAFLVSLTHFGFAYRLRVAVPFWHMLAAMFVFMSLQWTVASAAAKAAFSSTEGYFHRTPKGASGSRHHRPLPLTEAVLGGLLLASAIVLFAINIYRVL
jgi:hypothetical protein